LVEEGVDNRQGSASELRATGPRPLNDMLTLWKTKACRAPS